MKTESPSEGLKREIQHNLHEQEQINRMAAESLRVWLEEKVKDTNLGNLLSSAVRILRR